MDFIAGLAERRLPADQYRVPRLPGDWVDYYTERQQNLEDIEQFRHLVKPSVPTRIVRAISCAKRRCTKAAAKLYQRGVRLYEVVRDFRRAQALRRRRPQPKQSFPPRTPIQIFQAPSAPPFDKSYSTDPGLGQRESMIGYIRSSTLFRTFSTKHSTSVKSSHTIAQTEPDLATASKPLDIQDPASTHQDAYNEIGYSPSERSISPQSSGGEDIGGLKGPKKPSCQNNFKREQSSADQQGSQTFEQAYRHILKPRSETPIKGTEEETAESLPPLERLCLELRDHKLGGKQISWYTEDDAKPYKVSAETLTRRDARKAAKRAEEEKRAREERERQISEKSRIIPLSREWDIKVQRAVQAGHAPDFAAKDMVRVVTPNTWLNDESVNGYLKLATAHHNALHPSITPKSYAFTSFMFKTMQTKGYKGVERWAKRAKIEGAKLLGLDTIFFPINDGAHWTLMAVHPARRTAHYYDSMNRPLKGRKLSGGIAYFELLKMWLQGELGGLFVERDWTFEQEESPRQNNLDDCGVFTITTAKMLILGADVMSYGPEDIRTQRRRIVAELVNGAFL